MMAGFDLHSVCARCRDKKKGSDPCTKSPPEDCQHCDAFTPEQKTQIATPSYKLKKEKKDAKSTPAKDSDNSTLVDPALVSVLAVVDNQSTPGASTSEPVEKKKKTDPKHSKSSKSEKSVKQSSNRPATTSSESKPHSSSTDTKLLDMDKKWAERFNRLEALFLAKTVDPPRDPVFSTVKVTPAHAPPANVVRSDPFIKPQPQISQPTDPAGDSTTDSSLHKSDVKTSSTQPDPPATASVKKNICHLPLTSPAKNHLQVIPTPTHPQINPYWISYQKKGNCRTKWTQTSLIKNSHCRRSSPTGRLCGALGPIWGGIIYQILTQGPPPRRITPLQAPSHMHRVKCLSTYPLTSGCAVRWPS